jgi:hypothetical protein
VVEALREKLEGRGLIPDGVIGNVHCYNSSGGNMALASTQPVTKTSTRDISWW